MLDLRMPKKDGLQVVAELSTRELQVLRGLASGRSNKEIGQILSISECTVKGHVNSILDKLDAKGRTEAVTIATKRGLFRAGRVPAQRSRLAMSSRFENHSTGTSPKIERWRGYTRLGYSCFESELKESES
jgi:DNA-binding CsgD family transcriptional regulator